MTDCAPARAGRARAPPRLLSQPARVPRAMVAAAFRRAATCVMRPVVSGVTAGERFISMAPLRDSMRMLRGSLSTWYGSTSTYSAATTCGGQACREAARTIDCAVMAYTCRGRGRGDASGAAVCRCCPSHDGPEFNNACPSACARLCRVCARAWTSYRPSTGLAALQRRAPCHQCHCLVHAQVLHCLRQACLLNLPAA